MSLFGKNPVRNGFAMMPVIMVAVLFLVTILIGYLVTQNYGQNSQDQLTRDLNRDNVSLSPTKKQTAIPTISGSSGTVVSGSTIQVPIVLSSNSLVTAADFSVEVSGGALESLDCSGDEFSPLEASSVAEDQCVVLNTSGGATQGKLATATVTVGQASALSVTATGLASTADGVEPGQYSFEGANYQVN